MNRPVGLPTPWFISACGFWLVLAGAACPAAQRPSPPREGDLPVKAITFNAQFLPGPVGAILNKRRDPSYRARTLGRLLAEGRYDVIALNEVFDPVARELLTAELKRGLGEDFHCVVPPSAEQSALGVGSGLMLVTRLRILQSRTYVYGNDSRPREYGLRADGFARKGILHARLGRPAGGGQTQLDVFVTHLESRDPSARMAQVALLAKFVGKEADPRSPALVLGDFNIDGRPASRQDKSPYERMLQTLREVRPDLKDLWSTLYPSEPGSTLDHGQRIDYVFFSNPAVRSSSLRPTAVRINRFSDPRVVSLSDHSAVEAEFVWESAPTR